MEAAGKAPSPTASEADVPQLTEHLFRQESGKLVSVLTGIFGADRLQMAEDVVQEALVRAMQTWPYQGVPKNPAAWLMQTAKHLALDLVRREKRFHEKQPEIIAQVEGQAGDAEDPPSLDGEIKDDRLRLMFTCCHPLIPPDSQAALSLKTLCGLGTTEIAAAFLTTEAAIAKRLTRARQRIQEQKIPFEIPCGPELASRLDGVRQTLLLLFNEGYKASSGETLVREDICAEAIRLTTLLAEHPAGNQPRTHALLALMLLNGARLPARVDSDGNILRLKEQNRSLWNREMIARGIMHLGRSAAGDELSEYHLHAGIAACHDTAADDASTDWRQILALYDRLAAMDDSPVIALNRAVAVANVHGPAQGLKAVQAISGRAELSSYYLLYAVLGEFESQLDNDLVAASHFHRAAQLADLKSEQAFLAQRLRDCEERLKSQPTPARGCL
ncbi:MAG: sigma-70 family RNA polymerase sigma factor [Chthoniobacter sp.]|uniref:RNA polymerase sigma factor n=1 Tax=Chthoniobacter sp. TaxID=2510640 RepID=UPI0032AE4096